MPDYRKPPVRSGGRIEDATLPSDEMFSIETTTMRLKSLKLRRAEAADKALDEHLTAKTPARPQPAAPVSTGPAGRVRHDERGMAVWDWAAASGETAGLSATHVMRTLDVSSLSIEQTQRTLKALEIAPRDAGGGSDPYNQRSGASRDPFKRVVSGSDPYNHGNLATPGPKKPGISVLDQLTGKKK